MKKNLKLKLLLITLLFSIIPFNVFADEKDIIELYIIDTHQKEKYTLNEDYNYEGLDIYLYDSEYNQYIYGKDIMDDGNFTFNVSGFNSEEEVSELITVTICYKDVCSSIEKNILIYDDSYLYYPTKLSIVDIPSNFPNNNNDYSEFKFIVEYSDQSYKSINYNNENFNVRDYGDFINIIYRENEKSVNTTIDMNDYRYYDNNNDSNSYTLSTDYEVHHQDMYDINNDLPDKYDLRDYMNIEVENQGNDSTCWDFATTKAIETNYYLKNNENLDLSEAYINYMTSTLINGRRDVNSGGYYTEYYAQVVRSGIPLEETVPYRVYDISELDLIINSEKKVLPTSAIYINAGEIKSLSSRQIITEMIKSHIINNGSFVVSLDFSMILYDYETNTLYRPYKAKQEPDDRHAVSIIGWDDSIKKELFKRQVVTIDGIYEYLEPKNDGAWIVQNSWGEEMHDHGVLYISYETNFNEYFGIINTIPYESRKEYTYVDKANDTINVQFLDSNQTEYIYQEFNIEQLNEYITNIEFAGSYKGTLYYIDNYDDIHNIDFNNIKKIGDFSISQERNQIHYPEYFKLRHNPLLNPNFVFDSPIKINGNKLLIILKLNGYYNPTIKYMDSIDINTYYTINTLSSDMIQSIGNYPIYVYTIINNINEDIKEGIKEDIKEDIIKTIINYNSKVTSPNEIQKAIPINNLIKNTIKKDKTKNIKIKNNNIKNVTSSNITFTIIIICSFIMLIIIFNRKKK